MIHIEVPNMTIRQLSDHITAHVEPTRRSTHIGNQPPHELAIMAGLPNGVDVLMVDTIQGDDRYTAPYLLKTGESDQVLLSKSSIKGKVIGSVNATDPSSGELKSLITIHNEPFEKLRLSNSPIAMLRFFRQYPDNFRAVIAACQEAGELRRHVGESGKIHSNPTSSDLIYGLDGDQGVLIPLNGMMAMDMIISEALGSNSTLHLAGPDMIGYVQEPERIGRISDILARAYALLGLKQHIHTYRVVDTRGLATTSHRSQHHLLALGDDIDLSSRLDEPTGFAA